MNLRAITALALLLGTAALADDSPENTVRYRHVVMDGVGSHMKASATIVKGEMGRIDDLKLHARAIHDASTYFANLFPEGTGPDKFEKTEALPKIWEDKAGFEKANQAWQDAAKKFLEAAETGKMEEIRPAMGALGKSCGGCHDDFRKDED